MASSHNGGVHDKEQHIISAYVELVRAALSLRETSNAIQLRLPETVLFESRYPF